MFTFMRSITAKLAVKFAQHPKASAVTVAELQSSTQLYDPSFSEELFMRLHVVRAQDRTVLGHIRRVLEKGREPRTQSAKGVAPATPAVTISEIFDFSCIGITEGTETSLDQMGLQAPVQAYQDDSGDLNFPYTTYELYDDFEGDLEPGNEADSSVSVSSQDASSDASDYKYQDLSSVLGQSDSEWGSSDIEYSSSLRAEHGHDDILSERGTENDVSSSYTEAGDNSSMPTWSGVHGDEVASPLIISNENSLRTANPISTLFCPPTPVSTLAPLTPYEGESGTSMSHYAPVLVHESASYEEALYSEFKAMLATWRG
ncbi:hypothetical protein BC827DRAFT_828121 [Russula dissimulans]|nr:hypothetical protein BC827DRAFT_828121 [Russula dissimulans]